MRETLSGRPNRKYRVGFSERLTWPHRDKNNVKLILEGLQLFQIILRQVGRIGVNSGKCDNRTSDFLFKRPNRVKLVGLKRCKWIKHGNLLSTDAWSIADFFVFGALFNCAPLADKR